MAIARAIAPFQKILLLDEPTSSLDAQTSKYFRAEICSLLKGLEITSVFVIHDLLGAEEIADRIALPPSLAKDWYNRGYYGSMSFNSRAVYQRYMGWYDANPVHLEPYFVKNDVKVMLDQLKWHLDEYCVRGRERDDIITLLNEALERACNLVDKSKDEVRKADG